MNTEANLLDYFAFFSIKYSTETSKEIVEPTRILKSDK